MFLTDITQLGRMLDWQAQLKPTHLKIVIGASTGMLVRFIVNAGSLAMM
jgi:hypothetical protein